MRAQKTQRGYTIVETLIVLAVTSSMFVATVILISGQIAKNQFKSAVYNAQQSIQGVLNDVQTGYYGRSDFSAASCDDNGSALNPGDSDCMYIGKSINISNDGVLSAYPLIADITSSSPIGKPASNLLYEFPDTINLPGSIDYKNSPLTTGDFLVLYSNYPNDSAALFTGGAQAVGIYGIDNSGNITQMIGGKYICLQRDGRKALLLIGRNGNLNVEVNYQPTTAECP